MHVLSQLQVNCARHDLTFAWVLGDPFHGVLGGTSELYF